MTEIYPVAQGIIEEEIASEREICEFLDFARPSFQRWKRFDLSPLEEEDKRLLPLIVKSFHAHRRRYGSLFKNPCGQFGRTSFREPV